jgi:pimeloyl-ACP methyl ester carboxylesterase
MKLTIPTILLPFMVFCFACKRTGISYPVLSAEAGSDSFIIETRPFGIGNEQFEADFGSLAVPENRRKEVSRSIRIPFLRIHSKSGNPSEPIFGLSGGPGQSNMNWDRGVAWTFLPDHDFVMVGYRGVDGSCRLDCPEVVKAFKNTREPLSEESIKAIGHAWSRAAGDLKKLGVDLDGYTMLECIEDDEAVRKALGYTHINLLSESYGTRIAYLYALKHPDHVLRSAMIAVNPPGHFVWEPRMIDAQLKYYATLWSKDPAMSGKSPDLYNTMRKVLDAIPHRWLAVPIDAGKVRAVTFSLLFQRSNAVKVFDTFIAAEKGDASGLALMSLAYDFVVPSLSVWGDLASKAVSADFDSSRNYSVEMDPTSDRPLGSPMSKLLWGSLSCSNWPANRLPDEFRRLQQSDVETLLLSGSVDFSTPYEFARNELLPYLKNGKQIIFSECGHVGDIWYVNIENTRLILKSFYNTGIADTSLNTYSPISFKVKWGFPVIAKTSVGVVAAIAFLLTAAIVKFIRRHRKRKVNLI